MDNVKPWQIILMVLAVAVLGFSIWRFALNRGPDLPDSVVLVDVKTGDLFRLDLGGRKRGYYPEQHPDTQERTLLPAYEAEDGTWFLSPHSASAIQDIKGNAPAVVDSSTGRLNVNEGSIRPLKK
jgi:hypothetical protein